MSKLDPTPPRRNPTDDAHRGPVRRRTVPTLRVLAGPDLLQFVTLSPNRQLRVGRDHNTDLPLTHATVSKLHARIAVDTTGQATVFDLKSTNGTAVNGRRVRRAPLHPGDRIEVGDVPLRLDLLSSDELNHLSRVCERFDAPGRDPNTGLSPIGYLETELPTFVSRCERSSTALSSLYILIDRYGELRERHGTAVSALVLRGVARLTALAVRDADPCVAGGPGIIHVLLKGSTLSSAAEVAERIRRTIAGHDWARDAPNLLVTTSIGVAARLPNESIEQWLARSEGASQRASDAGRNRVERAMARGNLREVIESGM